MKKIGVIAAVFIFVIALAFRDGDKPAREQARDYYHASLDAFQSETGKFKAQVDAFAKGSISETELRQNFADLRLAFKKAEVLYAYLDPEFVKDYINGAPLFKHERNAPKVVVLAPKGLQRMEELVYDDLSNGEVVDELKKLAYDLENKLASSAKYQRSVLLSDRLILEALRLQMVRILTLNLTGFDTPAGVNTLQEAKEALRAVDDLLQPYLRYAGEENRQLAIDALAIGEAYFNEYTDFDTFDRLGFTKEVVNPLYKTLRDIHLELGIETRNEVDVRPMALDYAGENIFSDDFFDPGYFMGNINPAHEAQITDLGRTLFFDPVLSSNNDRACASCHSPSKAFTDGKEKSVALNFTGTVERNSPTIINALFSEKFFYDLRTDRLTGQMEHVIYNHQEFNTDFQEIFEKLEKSSEYTELFAAAFPGMRNEPINKHTLTTAVAAYVASLTSFNSEFDRFVRGEIASLDQKAYDGFNLFMGKAACGTCHFAPVFNGLVPPEFEESESEVLGLPALPGDSGKVVLDKDPGRAGSKRLSDESWVFANSFKTVTVRNVELTAPYMHNGAYPDLESVVDFYNRGGGIGHGLDVPNQTLPPDPLGLNDYEKEALIAFMKSLTDPVGLDDKPERLPQFEGDDALNNRVIGGVY